MKFQIKVAYMPTAEMRANKETATTRIVEMEGELAAVKTYLKLSIGNDFHWASVVRIDDELGAGDVNRWVVQSNRTTGDLRLLAFSFFEVDPVINTNGYNFKMAIQLEECSGAEALNKVLGGGKF